MDISYRPYGHCAASTWLILTFELASVLNDRAAVWNLVLFTLLGSRDILPQRMVVQDRDPNCSCSYIVKRKIVNAASVYAHVEKRILVYVSCVFVGYPKGHAPTA